MIEVRRGLSLGSWGPQGKSKLPQAGRNLIPASAHDRYEQGEAQHVQKAAADARAAAVLEHAAAFPGVQLDCAAVHTDAGLQLLRRRQDGEDADQHAHVLTVPLRLCISAMHPQCWPLCDLHNAPIAGVEGAMQTLQGMASSGLVWQEHAATAVLLLSAMADRGGTDEHARFWHVYQRLLPARESTTTPVLFSAAQLQRVQVCNAVACGLDMFCVRACMHHSATDFLGCQDEMLCTQRATALLGQRLIGLILRWHCFVRVSCLLQIHAQYRHCDMHTAPSSAHFKTILGPGGAAPGARCYARALKRRSLHMQDDALVRQVQLVKEEVAAWYHQHMAMVSAAAGTSTLSLDRFMWAFALVQSRALAIEMPDDGLSTATVLVPILELANHDAFSDSGHHFDLQVRELALQYFMH